MYAMKRIVAVLVLSFLILPLKAQVNNESFEDYQKRIEQEKKQYVELAQQDYYQFRQKANEEYAQFMRERWEEFQSIKGEPVPEIPEPPQPFEREKDQPIPELPIKYNKVITIPTQEPAPLELPKQSKTPVTPVSPSLPEFNFSFYGTPCMVHFDNDLKFQLSDVKEKSVADVWTSLSEGMSDVLLDDLFQLRKKFTLGDWAFFCLIRDFSEQYFGKSSNEAVLMETYLMAQSGYKVRIARKGKNLVLLLSFDSDAYQKTYFLLNGEKFYIIDNGKENEGDFYVFNRSFTDNDRSVSLRMPGTPKLTYKTCGEKTFASKRYPDMTVTLSPNQNLMDFYEGYPKCVWTNYSWAGLSDEVKAKLYPILRKSIEGKSQIEAANRLINFVQTAFEYKTDKQQFGHERSFFADETFFFPYSDCEDRAILFSVLVRDLLDLEVVLLFYTDHLATAVHYTEELNGVNFTMDGKTFYISDPTYIGAKVGECMPCYVKANPRVYKL